MFIERVMEASKFNINRDEFLVRNLLCDLTVPTSRQVPHLLPLNSAPTTFSAPTCLFLSPVL
ncbi:hypothetical protein PILCRDRAFT_816296 [Piloderma croceum F 1598]|uniref:Uncharacterized protein n=1 Tax=Piloderma croceum (strain F 1598) TaxID=765440 RepID=A0A0C3FQF5_PILCF|nr:hypothetical protein PILCRDRAFT_816296 [Piloderma croceum F 1598]